MIKLKNTTFALKAGLLFSIFQVAHANDESLCNSNESIIAACQINGQQKKILSICSSPSKAKNKYVVYRYGALEKIEFNYLVNESNRNKIYRGSYSGASNMTTLYWFYAGNYLYKVAIPLTGLVHLYVLNNGKKIFSKECTTNALGDIEIKNDLIIEKDSEEMFKIWLKGGIG